MDREKTVRAPKQARSVNTKEKILDTAYRLFCEKGYYKTTTNEIAKTAGISIGSLYSYFKDKDTIFMEILERYHREFVAANEKMTAVIGSFKTDIRSWLRRLIESLIQLHEIGKELNHEITVLCYTKPEVAAIMEQHMENSRKITLDCFQLLQEDINYDDIEAAATVTYDFTSSIVDRIVFGKNTIDRERIIKAGVEALYRFLVVPQPQ